MKKETKERITKDPEERRQELIDAAERLFMEKGYEQTAVSDIVREVQVAHGTFYYYFPSKEDILEAVIEKNIAELESNVREIMQQRDLATAFKLNLMVNSIIGINVARRKLMDYLHEESNAVMHEKMERRTVDRLVPLLAEVVAFGAEEGCFSVQNPRETAEFLLASLVYFFHHPEIFANPRRSEKMRRTLETILGRVLAVKNYNFVLTV
ncbi:MAG: TetR/AcrR family transcriptional regulator [Methanothrix sp.]|nr:TetR/AcrR family transcriptional regulator [Methanothrix sp.]